MLAHAAKLRWSPRPVAEGIWRESKLPSALTAVSERRLARLDDKKFKPLA